MMKLKYFSLRMKILSLGLSSMWNSAWNHSIDHPCHLIWSSRSSTYGIRDVQLITHSGMEVNSAFTHWKPVRMEGQQEFPLVSLLLWDDRRGIYAKLCFSNQPIIIIPSILYLHGIEVYVQSPICVCVVIYYHINHLSLRASVCRVSEVCFIYFDIKIPYTHCHPCHSFLISVL